MDSREVNRGIRVDVWPLLKSKGFASFTSRTAWRHHNDRIDVVNFQSFNSHRAQVLGVTTYSFAVNLGCYMSDVPQTYPLKVRDGVLLPDECDCHFRASLQRCCFQLWNRHNDIWKIDKAGKALSKCLKDAANQIERDAFAWFERLSDRRAVLRLLQTQPVDMEKLWGFGSNPSPIRSYLTGYVALRLGETDLARLKLQEAVDSGCFKDLFTDVAGALARAR